jgi:cystathionine beta-lyase/cystathionine gamma-synthase
LKGFENFPPDCVICVDNTWCTGYGFNPFTFSKKVSQKHGDDTFSKKKSQKHGDDTFSKKKSQKHGDDTFSEKKSQKHGDDTFSKKKSQKHGVDIILESTTKYISAGKCIGGIILAKRSPLTEELMDDVDQWIRIYGQFVAKDHCVIFREGVKTLKSRLEHISDISLKIAEFLEKDANVSRVMFPTLPR